MTEYRVLSKNSHTHTHYVHADDSHDCSGLGSLQWAGQDCVMVKNKKYDL